jgi:glutamate 5-kinase
VSGEFSEGEAVVIATAQGEAFARGLVRYSSAQLRQIQGQASQKIAAILGFSMGDEVVHRDDLVLLAERMHTGGEDA